MRKLLYLIAIISLLFNCGTASAKEKKDIKVKNLQLIIKSKKKHRTYNLIGDFTLKKQKTYQRYT